MEVKEVKKRHKWTEEEKDYLRHKYLKYGYKRIPQKFNQNFGLNLSSDTIWSQCEYLGLQGQLDDAMYTLNEASELLGCSHETLKRRIMKGTVKAEKKLNRYYISEKELNRLNGYYLAKAPWPAIPSSEAQKRLGYTCANLAKLVQTGSLTGIKCGKILMIKLSDIERAEKYLAKTGNIRVPWAKLKAESEGLAT